MQVKAPTRTILAGGLAFAGFAVVMTAIEYLNFRGQIEFGRHYFHLAGPTLAAAYLALQGGMLASAALELWAVLAKDGWFGHRLWTGITLAAACTADYLGALAAHWPTIGAAFTAGFAVLALRTWHAILKRISRDLRSAKYSLLRYPLLRWVLARGETLQAFRVSVVDGLAPDAALARVRGEAAPPRELLTADGQDVRQLSKTAAIEAAYGAIGSYDVAAAMAWLADRGVTANRSTFYDVRDRLVASARAELHQVTSPARKATKAAPAAAPAPAKKAVPAKRAPARKAAPTGTPEITVRQVS